MRISPAVTLGLSLVFGVAAVFAARHYTKSDTTSDAVEIVDSVKEATVPVVVAIMDIGRGEVVDGLNLSLEQWPESQAPFGRFASVEAVGSNEYTSRQAMTAIGEGEPVLDSRLSPLGMRPSLAGRLEPGFRAYTIRMNDVSGVAGFVLPGDRVDVLLTKDMLPESKTVRLETELLLQNIEVLGVDLNDDMRSDQPRVFSSTTLAVTLDDIKLLSVATATGSVSLALRGTRDIEVVDVVLADKAVPVAPKRPVRRPRRVTVSRAAPKPKYGKVEVILGEVRTDVTVPAGGQP